MKLTANIIFVADITKAKAWYEKNLGMVTVEYRPPEFLEMKLGSATFYIETSNPNRAEGFKEVTVGGVCSAIIGVEDIKKAIEVLKKNGVKILVEPVQQFWGGWNAKIEDPDGNIFTLDQDEEVESKTVSMDDFKKVEIRIGKILSAEKVPETDKLLKLSVDFAEAVPRQIISGIALYFPDPAVLVGKKVAFTTNLEPRMIRGLESQGMVLATNAEVNGEVVFSLLEVNEKIPAGSLIK